MLRPLPVWLLALDNVQPDVPRLAGKSAVLHVKAFVLGLAALLAGVVRQIVQVLAPATVPVPVQLPARSAAMRFARPIANPAPA